MTHRPNTLVTLLRRLRAPLAVAAMLLGLAGNANAQLAFPTGSGIGVFPNFALTLIYPSGVAITPTTFPAATGGTGAVTYALPDPPTGLTFNPSTRVLTGTPVAPTSNYGFDYVATDSATPPARATTTASFDICATGGVPAGNVGCTLAASYTALVLPSAPDQSYLLNLPITARTFPAATGGSTGGTAERPTEIYSLTPLPSGLTFDAATRVLSGTPDTSGEVDTTYAVQDAGTPRSLGRHSSRPLTLFVNPATPVPLTGTPPATQTYTVGTPITPLTLPGAVSTDLQFTYTLTGPNGMDLSELPGLSFDAGTRVLSGTPMTAAGARDFTYLVAGGGSARTVHTISITVASVLALANSVPATQTYTSGTAITPLTLPTPLLAAGGPITYTLVGPNGVDLSELPGLTFDTSTRVLSGTPTTAAAARDFTYTVSRDNEVATHTISITVEEPAVPTGVTLSVNPATVTESADATTITVTATVVGGTFTGERRVTLSAGSASTATVTTDYTPAITQTITIPANMASGSVDIAFTATVDADVEAGGETVIIQRNLATSGGTAALSRDIPVTPATLTINDPVSSDTAPSFAVSSIPAQNFVTGTTVDLTLPVATGGNDAIVYTLTPAIAGLTLDPSTRVLTGAPTTAAGATTYTYTAADSDANEMAGDTATLTVSITVRAPATGLRLEAVGQLSGLRTTVVREGTSQNITVNAAPAPDGSGFAVDQQITFTVTPPPAARPANAADRYVAYTAVAPGTIAYPVDSLFSAAFDFTLAPTDDAFDHADFPVTITVTAQPSGLTGTVRVTLTDNDIRIITTAATASVAAGATTTYDVTLSEAPPADTTVTVASQGTATATVSPATLAFTTTNWNTPRTVTVTGVAVGTTTIRHDALAVSGFAFVANRVAVTVTAAAPPDTPPSFAVTSIPAQNFVTGTAVDLTLPQATDGNDAIVYTLTPAIPGLTLEPTTGVLSGMPTTAAGATTYTYTAADSDTNEMADDQTSLTVSITVRTAATGFTVSVLNDFNNLAVSTLTEGNSRPIRVIAVPTPAGSAFAVDQQVTFTATAPLASPPANAADPYVAYNAVAPGTLPLAATEARVVFSLNFFVTEDALDHADFPLTFTATASPSGATGTATITLLDNDIRIITTAATASVAAAATTTYDVTLGEAPPADTTVTVASQAVGTATVSPATLAFTTTNWNMAQTVTVTGVAAGSTTIRHTAPTASDFSYVTNDVAVTVTAGGPPLAVSLGDDQTIAPGAQITVTGTVTGAVAPDASLTIAWALQNQSAYFAAVGGAEVGRVSGVISTNSGLTLTFPAPTAAVLAAADPPVTSVDIVIRLTVTDPMAAAGQAAVMDDITITVNDPDTAPAFAADAMIPLEDSYPQHGSITPVTLPEATGGNGDLTYTLTTEQGTLPAGLTFNGDLRPPTLTGTPSVFGGIPLTYTVTDADGNTAADDSDMLTFVFTVAASDRSLGFPDQIGLGFSPLSGQIILYYTRDQAITPITFPAATGGVAPLSYDVRNGMLPRGLTFDADFRVLSGTPSAPGVGISTYEVTDSTMPDGVADTVETTIVICESGGTGTPDGLTNCGLPTYSTLAFTPPPAGMTFENTRPVTSVTLPAATGGYGTNPVRIYTAMPLPPGLTFDPGTRAITGTPTTIGSTTVNYRVVDAGEATNTPRSTTATFDIVVAAVVNTAPTAFTLSLNPTAVAESADSTDVTATVTLTGGTFTVARAFQISTQDGTAMAGTDYTAVSATTLTIPAMSVSGTVIIPFAATPDTAVEASGETVTFQASFRVVDEMSNDNSLGSAAEATLTINDPPVVAPTGFNLSVVRNPGAVTVTTVLEGVTQALNAIAAPTPAGSVFAADQTITFTVTPAPLASPPANAADPYVAYTAITPGTIALAVGAENAVFNFSLATTDDALDHMDFPLTITATASPSGATGTAMVTLRDNDIRITTTAASASAAVGATATYDVQLSEAPSADTTVTVASQGAATATVSPATLTFTTTNWNTALPVTVTGVAVGSTTIRHSAPTSGGFDFVTNDVAVTVTAGAVTPPTSITLSATPTTIMESADPTDITFTATLVGGGYAEERVVTVDTQMGTADPTSDYTGVSGTNLTIPANAASGSVIIPFTARVDLVADSGETVLFRGRLRDATGMNFESGIAAANATITINDSSVPATGFTVTLLNPVSGSPATEVGEGGTPSFNATVAPAPAGSVFAAEQVVTLTAPTPPTRPANAADPFVPYTAVTPVTLTVPANSPARVEATLSLAIQNDAFDHADFPLTITATGSPSGATGTVMLTLRDNDIRITTSAASASADVGATATYDVTLSEAPSADTTVAVASQAVGTATVSPATLAFTTANWNMAQPVTVTGVAAGSTTIRHSAPTTAGSEYVTNNVAVTVTAPVLVFTGDISTLTLYYPLGAAITATTFPAVTGGTSPYTYDTPGATLPAGLTFDAATRILSGTPSAAGSSSFNYRVTDNAMPAAIGFLEVTTVICESGGAADGGTVCAAPAFVPLVLATPAGLEFQHIRPITAVTLPEATGGTGANPVRIYTATPLPVGLAFDPATRVISGRPETLGTFTVNYRVGDAGAGNANAQSTTVMFDLVVFTRPNLGIIENQVYAVGDTVALTLPVGNAGSPPYTTYTLTRQGNDGLPAGLTWNTDVSPQTITGMPTAVTALADYRYEVTDSRGLTGFRLFSIVVNAEPDTAPAFAADASIADQFYTVGQTITPLTLPEATGGNGALAYSLVTPPGLNFDLSTRVLSGTPTTATTVLTYSYVASDADTDSVSLPIRITVNAAAVATRPTFFQVASSVFTNYDEGGTAVGGPTTFFAEAGTETVVLTLSGADASFFSITQAGALSFNPAPDFEMPRGMPFVAGSNTNTYRVTITATASPGGLTQDQIVTVQVVDVDEGPPANTVPTFSGATITAQTFTVGTAVDLTLPVATGGNGAITYNLLTASSVAITDLSTVIPGLTLNAAARTITGAPTEASTLQNFAWTARDADDDMNTSDRALLLFSITVNTAAANAIPVFPNVTIPSQDFTVGVRIMPLSLPRATGGDGALTYTLTPAIPGLTLNPTTLTLTGTPTTVAEAMTHRYVATDMDDDTASLTFRVAIEAAGTGTAPTFGGATVSEQFYAQGTAVDLTLPVATGGSGTSTYTLTPALPTGLIFNAAARTITGTPTTTAGATAYTYTVTDTNSDSASLMFSITVEADTAPDFGTTTLVEPSGTIAQNRMITPITLPAATGGNGPIIYTLPALPAGLIFDAATGVISGTPESVVAEMDYIYTAADSDGNTMSGDEDTLTVRFEVILAPPTGIRLSVNPAAVTESTAATTITLTATLIDGSFADARNISFMSTDGTATAGTDYTAVPDTALTFPANATSVTATFSFTTVVDTNAEAGGETVIIGRNLATAGGTAAVDREIPVSPATLTINDYDLVVDAGADQTVAPGDTITLTGEVTGSTDITTTWALSDSAATRAALVAAGLATAESTTEVARLTNALAGTGPDRTFPAPAANLGLTDPVALAFTLTVTDDDPPAGQDAATAMDEVTITVEANTTATTTTLNEAILPEVTRALVHSTSSSITRRVGQAVGSIPVPTAGSFNLAGQQMGGQDNLARALQTHGEAMSSDSRDIKEMLAGSEFVLPLNATGGAGGASPVAFWGSGEYRDFSGESDDLDWDGDLTGFQLGLDARLRNNLLVGVAVSVLETDVDYQDDTGILGQGDYELDLTSAHPYIGWRAGELDLWATVGYGSGDLEITEQGETAKSGDVNLQTIGGGGSGMLWQDGTTTLRLKGEVSQTQLEVEQGDDFAEQEIDATGIRIALEATRPRRLAGGGIFEPSLEVAARYDGGDGETGGGAEVGGALRYRNPATGLTADGRIRALIGQGGDYEEWGISGTIRVAPGTDGQGLSFSLSPGYGDSGSGIQELWRHGLVDETSTATTDDYAMKLDARIGYGLGFTLNQHHGILTPYSELTYGTTDSYRMGLNWAAGTRFDLTLLGERREPSTNPAEHAVLLKGEVRF